MPDRAERAGVVRALVERVRSDRLVLVAAGVASYAMLALVPALVVLLSLYGLAADPSDVHRQTADLFDVLPGDAASALRTQLTQVAEASTRGLGVAAVAGLVTALWAASGGVQHLVDGLNLAFGYQSSRRWGRARLRALVLVLGLVVITTGVIGLIGLLAQVDVVGPVLRWGSLVGGLVLALLLLYRFGPEHQGSAPPRVPWRGIALAVGLWLPASAALAWYADGVGTLERAHGSLTAPIVLLLCLMVSAFAVLAGAELERVVRTRTLPAEVAGVDAVFSQIDPAMVVVTAEAGGEVGGCLVGFHCQASIHPPRLLVMLSTANRTFRIAGRSTVLGVHLLGPDGHELAEWFGAETGDHVDKLAATAWHRGAHGAPILDEAAAWIEGAVESAHPMGDHVGFLLRPLAAGQRAAVSPLRYDAVADVEAGHPA